MVNKTPTLLVFMTQADELRFSRELLSQFPEITFIETGNWEKRSPKTRHMLNECHSDSPQHSIWNKLILPEHIYSKNYIFPNENKRSYFGATVGPGLIQYIRPHIADYDPSCLRNGRLSASYDPKKDPATDLFVKTVFKIARKGAVDVFLVDRKTGNTSDKPETHFLAWPDAANCYNGQDGSYLTNNAFAYFVGNKKQSGIK
ncbi:hypothetical protein KMS_R27150 [Pseudomonas sp. LRP2-20]|uniref:hypothetical protein n=1 Tax=Pseudomonas sp. LRP2-20 TaxID=2944234 RepID=UPI002186F732|nr:hypothetical protein [Pseudomonas sp. LRP2-20]BDM22958.1 hypothetical protein KMS_R27150 [Pseudomonas sp. LRP2-20]